MPDPVYNAIVGHLDLEREVGGYEASLRARGSLDHDLEKEVIRVAVARVGSWREIEAALARKEGKRFIARARLVQTSACVVSGLEVIA